MTPSMTLKIWLTPCAKCPMNNFTDWKCKKAWIHKFLKTWENQLEDSRTNSGTSEFYRLQLFHEFELKEQIFTYKQAKYQFFARLFAPSLWSATVITTLCYYNNKIAFYCRWIVIGQAQLSSSYSQNNLSHLLPSCLTDSPCKRKRPDTSISLRYTSTFFL